MLSDTHATGPWHLKRGGSPQNPTYTLHDLSGNTIAELVIPNNPDRSYTTDQFRNTQNLLLRAPLLLAALTEYALHSDIADGGITPRLRDLILEAGGKDLTHRVAANATSENPQHKSPPKPVSPEE